MANLAAATQAAFALSVHLQTVSVTDSFDLEGFPVTNRLLTEQNALSKYGVELCKIRLQGNLWQFLASITWPFLTLTSRAYRRPLEHRMAQVPCAKLFTSTTSNTSPAALCVFVFKLCVRTSAAFRCCHGKDVPFAVQAKIHKNAMKIHSVIVAVSSMSGCCTTGPMQLIRNTCNPAQFPSNFIHYRVATVYTAAVACVWQPSTSHIAVSQTRTSVQ